jgi:hypothetical protein
MWNWRASRCPLFALLALLALFALPRFGSQHALNHHR